MQTPDGILKPNREDDACDVLRPEMNTERVQPDAQLTWRVNVRVLIGLLAVAVILPILTAIAHNYQMQRMAALFLQRAEDSEKSGDLKAAASNIARYLQFRPDDLDAAIRMALHLESTANKPQDYQRVYYLFNRILLANPYHRMIRQKRANLILTTSNEPQFWRVAVKDLEILKAQISEELSQPTISPDRAAELGKEQIEIELLRAKSLEQLSMTEEAIEAYRSLLSIDPSQTDAYKRLAGLLDQSPDHRNEASEVLDALVRRNRNDSSAYVSRAYHYHQNGQLPAAIEDAREAMNLDPENPEVLVLASTLVASEKKANGRVVSLDIQEIRDRLETALGKVPPDPADKDEDEKNEAVDVDRTREMLIESLANLDVVSQQPDAAIQRLKKGLADSPNDLGLYWMLANILTREGRTDEAKQIFDEQLSLKLARPLRQLLLARIHEANSEWREAIDACVGLSSSAALREVMPGEVELLRANCEGKLGHTHRQLLAYREAIKANPSSIVAITRLADTLTKLGRVNEAREVLKVLNKAPGITMALAQLEIAHNLQLPNVSRDWTEAERLLDVAAGQREDLIEILITRAKVRVHQGNTRAAFELLNRARQEQPGRLKVWIAMMQLAISIGNFDEAFNILDQADEQFGQRPDLLLARLQLLPTKGAEQARELIDKLAESLDDSLSQNQEQLLRGIAFAYEEINELDMARAYWKRVSDSDPTQIDVLRHRFDLALRAGDLESIAGEKGLLAEIGKIEGTKGPIYRLETARYQIALAQRGDRSQLENTRRSLQKLVDEAAMLEEVYVAIATLEQVDDNEEQIVNNFQRAIDHGSTDPRVVRYLAGYFNNRGKFRQANAVIEQFRKNSRRPLSAEFGRMAAWTSAWNRDFEQAIDYAYRTVSPNSKDYREFIFLGQLYRAAGKNQQAELSFLSALKLDKDSPETWVAWINFLREMDREDEIPGVLKDVDKQFPAADRPLALAQCYEAAREIETAEKYYRAALQANRKDPVLQQTVAEFFARKNQLDIAEKLLREVLAENSSATELQRVMARRTLALILGTGGSYPKFQEALRLLEHNLTEYAENTADLRVKASLLALRSSRQQRIQALKIFRRLENRAILQPDDQWTVARVNLSLGDWTRARTAILSLRDLLGESPDLLEFGIRAMMDNGDIKLAGEWLETLVKIRPDLLTTVELQARYQIVTRNVDKGLSIFKRATLPGKEGAKPIASNIQVATLLVNIAGALDRSGRAGDAQKVADEAHKYLGDTSEMSAEQILLSVNLLSREFHYDQALEILEKGWTTLNPELIAPVSLGLLKRMPNNEPWLSKVENMINAAVKKSPDSASLIFQQANLAHLRGDYDAAIRFYREALARVPESSRIRNELAILLALRGQDLDEAFQLINGAIESVGPAAHLLDTRATIYLAMNQPRRAIEDLKSAIADAPSAAKHFHMAQAWLMAGNPMAANSAFGNAISAGLKRETIHPLELPALKDLQQQLQ